MVLLPQKYCYPKGGDMTRASIREYTEAVRGRYLGGSKKDKEGNFLATIVNFFTTGVNLGRTGLEPVTPFA